MIPQTVFDTSQVLALKGIKHVVLSPGSRNAPLTISFARNPAISTYNIIDERSAGFIALGMAQKLKQPVALCCTSGTALLNYAPSVAEAYYQQIPLIVISADRPSEWQGQRDGQTINQIGALANFVKGTFQLPADTSHKDAAWEYTRKLNEAINLSELSPKGPIHINIPFREPFYPAADQKPEFSKDIHIISPTIPHGTQDCADLITDWHTADKRMIIAGQHEHSDALCSALEDLKNDAVVAADVISNVSSPSAIRHQDLFLAGVEGKLADSLRPDLIVSYGRSVISKNLKLFLRNNPPKAHWHFDESMVHADAFQSVSRMVKADPLPFFTALTKASVEAEEFRLQIRRNFVQNWRVENEKVARKLPEIIEKTVFCEFTAFHQVMEGLPGNIDLHLANSMPVRYVNFLQGLKPGVEVFANRGTSGIDGTNGAAVGNTLVSDRPTVLLTGDLSFFYDRNAFFHQYDLCKLKVVVFNNGGGGIFRLIPGPANLPELVQHFETRHSHSARFMAIEFGFDYYTAKDGAGLSAGIKEMLKNEKAPKLLEVFTSPEANSAGFSQIKKLLKS